MTPALADRVAIVTGASSGIGAAMAGALAGAGATVVLAARRVDRLDAVAGSIRATGGAADAIPTDVRDPAAIDRLVDRTVERHGRLDALVNNAGVGWARTVADGRVEEWRAILDTNLLATLVACRAALRHMLPCGRGDLVNVTSASAYEAWPYLAAYAASKAGVHALSQALRAEVAPAGVRVMTLEIHNVGETEFASGFDPAVLPEALACWHARRLVNPDTPLLAPADVARALVFQLSQPLPASIHHLAVRSRAN
jgi:NADP-dependent 3-hydroxy acid dehydrogenase YdfG